MEGASCVVSDGIRGGRYDVPDILLKALQPFGAWAPPLAHRAVPRSRRLPWLPQFLAAAEPPQLCSDLTLNFPRGVLSVRTGVLPTWGVSVLLLEGDPRGGGSKVRV